MAWGWDQSQTPREAASATLAKEGVCGGADNLAREAIIAAPLRPRDLYVQTIFGGGRANDLPTAANLQHDLQKQIRKVHASSHHVAGQQARSPFLVIA